MAPGAVFDTSRIADITTRVVVDEVLDLAQPDLNLRDLCKIVKVPKLVGDISIAARLTGQEKVSEAESADLSNNEFSKISFDLWKNVVHVAITDESKMRANIDVMQISMQDAGKEIARMENKQIAEALEVSGGISTIAGTDWDDDTNDPAKDIMAAQGQILNEKKGYKPDVIAMHPLTYSSLVANENVKKFMEYGTIIKDGGLPNIMGLKTVVDPYLTDGQAIVLTTKAPVCVLGIGPTEGEKIRDGRRGLNEYVIRQYLQPKLVIPDAARILTGLHG